MQINNTCSCTESHLLRGPPPPGRVCGTAKSLKAPGFMEFHKRPKRLAFPCHPGKMFTWSSNSARPLTEPKALGKNDMTTAINAHEITACHMSEAEQTAVTSITRKEVATAAESKKVVRAMVGRGERPEHLLPPGKKGSLATPESYALWQQAIAEGCLTKTQRALLNQPRKVLNETAQAERDAAQSILSSKMRDWREKLARYVAELERAAAEDALQAMDEAERAEAEAEQAEAELEKARVAVCEMIVRARKRSSNTPELYSVEALKQLAFHLDAALVAAGGNPEDV